jgi:ATP-dependent DNA helicase RecQ
VLKGAVPIEFRKDAEILGKSRRERGARPASPPGGAFSGEEEALWQRLRTRRLDLAHEQGVPPYVIFHDATLTEMVRRRPRTLADLAEIPGVGKSKLDRYGAVFLGDIAAG